MTPDDQERRWRDYRLWHHAQVETLDIDPVYPWLRAVADQWGLDAEQRAWLVICHVVWYFPGSTLVAFERCPSVKALALNMESVLGQLPTGTERRGHRDVKQLANHLEALPQWLPDGVTGYVGLGDSWEVLNDRIAAIPGNGRWAAYKTAEMLQKVCGLPVQATDAGHRFSSGPRKGLADLYGADVAGQDRVAIAELDRRTEYVRAFLEEPDIAQVETSLCDFHSAVRGHYYVGHDIDSMQESLGHPRVVEYVPNVAWEARTKVFDSRLLGELNGWSGVRSELKRQYRDTGRIDT